jgi:hypothetical protein
MLSNLNSVPQIKHPWAPTWISVSIDSVDLEINVLTRNTYPQSIEGPLAVLP